MKKNTHFCCPHTISIRGSSNQSVVDETHFDLSRWANHCVFVQRRRVHRTRFGRSGTTAYLECSIRFLPHLES